MLNNYTKSAQEILTETFKYLGLSDFNISIMQLSDHPNKLRIYLDKVITLNLLISPNPKQFTEQLIDPILNNIRESECIQDALSKLTKELYIANLKIKELEEYKTYFDMQKKMNVQS